VLLDFIAELAGEEYLLAPADPGVQARQNTWHLGVAPERRAEVTAGQVVAAFEAVARALDERLRPEGPATFYVWHDEQVGALKSALSSLGPGELLFGAAYEPTGEPQPPLPPFPVWVRTVAA
jgi:hypothetical protein